MSAQLMHFGECEVAGIGIGQRWSISISGIHLIVVYDKCEVIHMEMGRHEVTGGVVMVFQMEAITQSRPSPIQMLTHRHSHLM